ncbi:MAG: hypothetical protein HY059_09325 [Proteobacteria bacterium]|nr:hypothetical protein [Pseudomonadota bacterium]
MSGRAARLVLLSCAVVVFGGANKRKPTLEIGSTGWRSASGPPGFGAPPEAPDENMTTWKRNGSGLLGAPGRKFQANWSESVTIYMMGEKLPKERACSKFRSGASPVQGWSEGNTHGKKTRRWYCMDVSEAGTYYFEMYHEIFYDRYGGIIQTTYYLSASGEFDPESIVPSDSLMPGFAGYRKLVDSIAPIKPEIPGARGR